MESIIIPPTKSLTVTQVKVTGTVAPQATYDLFINLAVTRGGVINNIYNYYVTDEFPNHTDSSMQVDKVYNIAVIPHINTGDDVNAILYGAYKGPIIFL